MKHILLLLALITSTTSATYAQLTLRGFLKSPEGQTVLFGNDTSSIGNKLIWYGSKGAFRAGGINFFSLSPATQWDSDNVGVNSFASGANTIASGHTSTAMGHRTIASGNYSTAFGWYAVASGNYSTALGLRASTNGQVGSFVIGDASLLFVGDDDLISDRSQQFLTRFTGGYKLFTTSNTSGNTALGVELAPGGNAWITISDSARKENFRSADGEAFLVKISRMRLGSWNYKGQDARQYRHYGPMAQDFFTAFGHDELGIIGADKTINQADFDGVNLIAIQALIYKVNKLEAANEILQKANIQQQETFHSETASLRLELDQIKRQLSRINNNSLISER